jgi:hypothetical protein
MTGTEPFAVTLFPNKLAKTQERRRMALEQLADLIRNTRARNKDDLPWLKLARFGTLKSDRDCLRSDKNVVALSGVVGDYDEEKCALEAAAERLDKAGIIGLVYTTASHTDAEPHWRVVCPFSRELTPSEHYSMVARVNGLLNGILADESFGLSQSYYFGSTNGHPPEVIIVDGLQYLDQADELDETAVGRASGNSADHKANTPEAPAADIKAALELLPNDNVHWTEWTKIGMAAWRASGGSFEGLAAFDSWSRKAGRKYNAAETQERWVHYRKSPPDNIGFGALVHLVRQSLNDPQWLPPSRRPRIEPQLKPIDTTPRANSAPPEKPWPVLDAAAMHGLAGDVVALIRPNTESDPAGILLQFLAAYGNCAGRNAYYQVEGTRHYGNLFVALIGDSGKSRKGTGWRRVYQLFDGIPWAQECVGGGLASGEGLVFAIRDPIKELKTDKKTGEQTLEIVDPGVSDKRLCLVEEELSRPLTVMTRPDNTLSSIIRLAWDGIDLQIKTRKSPLCASRPHVSLVSHSTASDVATLSTRASHETVLVTGSSSDASNVAENSQKAVRSHRPPSMICDRAS